ncbi:MAG: nucleotidyl transferase AbiEii/AbiGii toxin family protein [Acidobacteriia bacterium]|nr:nucleotidyl transferase AbiEii/AbiGii toxin family protein [Terriglobia bacterium]
MRAKLLDRARDRKEDFQFMLGRWVAERFLYRLGKSDQREVFVLKGATLFLIWQGKLPRPTRDIDLLGYGSTQIKSVTESIRQICSVAADDGIVFDLAGITAEEIREEAEYGGIRVRIPAALDGAKAPLQIDIGFGDAVDPAPEETAFPVMLDMESPRLKTYPPEVVIAEKLQAMVHLGIANSRMKDFFDIWILSREQPFQMSRLQRAVEATFARRKTPLPTERPTALTDAFLKDKAKTDQWKAFLNRMELPKDLAELGEVGDAIAGFLMPVIEAVRVKRGDELEWSAKGPWTKAEAAKSAKPEKK